MLSALRTGRLYPPRRYPWYSFLLLSLSRPEGHSATERIMSMTNSNDTIGNRTRDHAACTAVPQPTAPPRAPFILRIVQNHHSPNKLQRLCPCVMERYQLSTWRRIAHHCHTAQVFHLLPAHFGNPQRSIVGGQTLLDAVMSHTSWNGSTHTTGDLKYVLLTTFGFLKEFSRPF